jgi:hypothetical protein
MLDWIEGSQRQHAVQSAIGEAEQLTSQQQFRAALDRLDQAIARWGAEGLVSLRARIDHERQQYERRIRVANAARSARESLDRDRPETAVDQLRAALADDPGEPELEALLATAEASLESKRKAQRMEQAGARVESLLQSRQFDRAVEEVEAALRQYPGAPELARLRNRVEESRLASCRTDAQSLLDREQFGAALEAAEAALRRFPSDTALQSMRAAAEAGKARQARERSIATALDQAKAARRGGKLDEAISILEKEEQKSGSSEEMLSLLARLRQDRAEQQQRQALARIVNRARQLSSQHDYGGAIEVIQAGLQELPGNPDLGILLEETRLAEFEHEQNEAARHASELVNDAVEKGNGLDAERNLELTLREFPENPQIGRMLDDLRRLRRQAEVEQLIAEIERLFRAGELDPAARKVETALRENTGEPRLARLAQQIADEQRRRQEVRQSLETARTLLEQGDAEAAVQELTRSSSRYPGEPELAALLESARQQAAQTWREAEIERAIAAARSLTSESRFGEAISELQRALTVSPANPAVEAALRETEHQKARFDRESAIRGACSQAETALIRGKAEEALSILAGALATYPGDPALLQVQQRAIQLQQDQERLRVRNQDLEALKKLLKSVKSAKSLAGLEAAERQVASLRARYPDDSEFRASESAIEAAIQSRRSKLAPPEVVPSPAVAPDVSAGLRRREYFVGGAVALALLAAVAVWRFTRTPSAKELIITTNPAGATLRIGNESCSAPECRFPLGDGTYNVEAVLEGYRPFRRNVTLPGAASPMRIDLDPLPTRVVISTNLEAGAVFVDGRNTGSLQQGKLTIESLPGGTRQIEVRGTGREAARVEVQVTPGKAPSLTRPLIAHELQALAISQLGRKANLISDGRPKTISAANRTLGALGRNPTVVQDLPEGPVEIALQESGRTWTYALQPSMQPTVAIFISANRDTGLLLVEAGVAGADVLVDGRLTGRTGENGRLEIALRTGRYRVSAVKTGYSAGPATRVLIERDNLTRAALPLKPTGAMLALVGVLPGTELVIDGHPVRTLNGDATLPVTPGRYTVELRKEGYRPVRLSRQFDPGSTVTLGPSEVTLVEIPKPKPDPRAIEAQRWEIARVSRDVAVLEQFRRDFPSSPYAAEAAARIEQLEWEAARGRNDVASLEAFLSRYPNSSHRAETEQRIARIAWETLDRNNRDALRAFAKQYPQYAQQALAQIARIEKDLLVKTDLASIQRTLVRLIQAFGRKDFREVASLWPGVPRTYRSNFQEAEEITLTIRPTSQLVIKGDTASVTCDWVFDAKFRDQRKAVPLTANINLVRRSADWTIDSIQFQR